MLLQVVPVFNHKSVDLLMRKWDMRLGQLEDARHALSITKQRPMMKVQGRCNIACVELIQVGIVCM